MPMTALRALLLSDGRPGHTNLSLGLLAVAEHLRPVTTNRIEVRRGYWPGAALAAWSNSGLAPQGLLRQVFGIDAGQLPKVDLVVSAGAETLAANIACARILGTANVFYGSLRSFRAEDFSLVLTSFPANATRPHHALALKPSPAAAAIWQAGRRRLAKPPKRITLLVGGTSGESTYTQADWDRLIHLMQAMAGNLGIRWLVSNSRRTPNAVSDRLGKLAIERLIDVRDPNAAPLSQIIGAADAALVTDESSSMVSDAVAAGLPVLGVAPARHALTGNEQDYRRHLKRNGWYDAAPLAGLEADAVIAKLSHLTPLAADPGQDLAALLRERLPALFPATP